MTKRVAIPKTIRDRLLVDCNHRCVVCHDKTPHVHHIVPLEESGTNDYDNLVALCPTCHDNVHMRHISPSQLRLYKHRWVGLCRAGLVAASLEEQQQWLHSALLLLERSHGWTGEPAYGFIDPGAPFVTTVADRIAQSCSALPLNEKEISRIGPEMFRFYQLLVRMKKNCARLRLILDSRLERAHPSVEILQETGLSAIIEDQSQTVFALFEHLITRADLFEVFIPGFPGVLWGLLNCREGLLSSIIYSGWGSETCVQLLAKVDGEAKRAGLDWTPYFMPPYRCRAEVNRAFGVAGHQFVTVDLRTADRRAYQYVSKHLKRLETALQIALDKFAKLLRDNFRVQEVVEELAGLSEKTTCCPSVLRPPRTTRPSMR